MSLVILFVVIFPRCMDLLVLYCPYSFACYMFCFSSSFVFINILLVVMFSCIQCLMYLYHYPDIWYDYASWHAKSGSMDAAIKVFQRALKALPGNWFFFSLELETCSEYSGNLFSSCHFSPVHLALSEVLLMPLSSVTFCNFHLLSGYSIIRFRNAKVCICRARGISWSNPSMKTVKYFHLKLLNHWLFAF